MERIHSRALSLGVWYSINTFPTHLQRRMILQNHVFFVAECSCTKEYPRHSHVRCEVS